MITDDRIIRFLEIAAVLLLLMVADQACALKRLAEFSELQDRIIDDYCGYMRSCDKETK